jgi:enamine deaminase RidA (YjgF/YER057c/UK114 family)
VDVDGAVRGESLYEQAVEILRKIVHELGRAGADVSDVAYTRAYVTDISRAQEVGRAHGEVFGDVRPCMTMVEVSALIDPRMVVEIEAVAVVGGG